MGAASRSGGASSLAVAAASAASAAARAISSCAATASAGQSTSASITEQIAAAPCRPPTTQEDICLCGPAPRETHPRAQQHAGKDAIAGFGCLHASATCKIVAHAILKAWRMEWPPPALSNKLGPQRGKLQEGNCATHLWR